MNSEFQNIALMFKHSAVKYKEQPAFAAKTTDGEYQFYTYAELFESACLIAAGLLHIGVMPGEKIGLFADNRYEWIQASMGITLAGCVDVPRGADITVSEIEYIGQHSEMTLAIVEDNNVLKKLKQAGFQNASLKGIISLEKISAETIDLAGLMELGHKALKEKPYLVQRVYEKIRPDELYTLIYTSGTTGQPKGVMLTQRNLLSQIEGLPFLISPAERILSILPVWHIFERVFEMIAIHSGCCTYYSSVRTLRDDLKTVKPTFMASAPRLWESIYSGILSNVSKASAIRRGLFRAAIFMASVFKGTIRKLKRNDLRPDSNGLFVYLVLFVPRIALALFAVCPFLLLDILVLKKIRSATGSSLRGSVSGGGALPYHVDEFFNNIGIPVLEGYGLTETSPVIAVRTFDQLVPGTVGPVYKDTEIRLVNMDSGAVIWSNEGSPGGKGKGTIGKQGELHVKGPQVTQGYYKNSEATAKVLRDGWFNTGDLCMMTANNCLKVVGRSKETIVLLGGENVEPGPIENRLLQSTYIQHCMLVGQDRKYLSALIVPEPETMKQFGKSIQEISYNQDAYHFLIKEVKSIINGSAGFKGFERVVDIRMLPKSFDPGDELTAKLSVKRHIVSDKYKNLIQEIYK